MEMGAMIGLPHIICLFGFENLLSMKLINIIKTKTKRWRKPETKTQVKNL